VQASVLTENNSEVYLQIAEWADGEPLPYDVSFPSFNGVSANFIFTPSSINTTFIQMQIVYPYSDTLPLTQQINLWIDSVNITCQTPKLYASNAERLFSPAENQSVTILGYNKLNPTKTVLTVNASEPFVIATSQALDMSWTASFAGQQAKPVPLYLGSSGFYVNSTGQFDVTIEYSMQNWFYYLSAISIITLVICGLYLVYSYLHVAKPLGGLSFLKKNNLNFHRLLGYRCFRLYSHKEMVRER
jgi:hypothetical protein